jgi:uncharacterized protein YvpB
MVQRLRVRSAPGLANDAILVDKRLVYGQVIEVDPESRTVADGIVWWRHDEGWSASETVNRSVIYMTPVESQDDSGGDIDDDAKIAFKVTAAALNIRSAPVAGSASLVAGKRLSYGQVIEVDGGSRTEASGFVWWRHDDGWSAQQSLDGTQEFMVVHQSTPLDGDLPRAVVLEVPWVSQLDPVTAPEGYDCGQACVLMLLQYYDKVNSDVTVKTLTDILSGSTTAAALKGLAALSSFGLALDTTPVERTTSSIASLRKLIAAGRPVILLVNYGDLDLIDHLQSGRNQGLHWLVLTGYDEDTFYVNDPLWLSWQLNGQGGRGGGGLKLSIDNLAVAVRTYEPALY